MKKNLNYYDSLIKTLVDGVKPALGCTEPVAVGLAVAKAYQGLGGEIKSIEVQVTPNIFKNGMGVGIPGTEEIGLIFASALGATCGDATLGFQVFEPVNEDSIKLAERLVSQDAVSVGLAKSDKDFYIQANIETDQGHGMAVIEDTHTNIVYVELNGEVIFEKSSDKSHDIEEKVDLSELTLKDIRDFVENVPFEEIEFLLEGVKLNLEIAHMGLKENLGAGLGAEINRQMDSGEIDSSSVNQARMLASAACDARMAGVNMPVMSSGGSGNQGITAIIPPTVICENIGCDDDQLARTLAYSHIITAFIKTFTGNLSPVCGCAICAGIGASSAIVWTLGGDDEQIGGAIKNMVGTLAGMVCDGAKGGCTFKISTAASEAIIQAQLSMNGVHINSNDGIVHPSPEETIKNLGTFCRQGMNDADETIIDIMVNKN